jgi:hypothetical protein
MNSIGKLNRKGWGESVPIIRFFSSTPFENKAFIASPVRCPGDSGPPRIR